MAVPSLSWANFTVFDAAGGDSITLNGADLSGATSVSDGTNTYPITGNTATTVTVTTPATTAGTKSVTVTTPDGTSNALSLKAWAPSSISGASHAWIADRGVTLVALGVSQLDDQIGTAHQTQATALSRPTLTNSASYGNKQVLACATQFLDVSGMAAIAKPVTILFVGHATSGTRAFASNGTTDLFWRNAAGEMEFFKAGGNRYATTGGGTPAGSAGAWRFSDDNAGGLVLAKNALNSNIGSVTGLSPTWDSTTSYGIGKSAAGVSALGGQFAELIIVSGVISTSDLTDYAIRTALRYALPVMVTVQGAATVSLAGVTVSSTAAALVQGAATVSLAGVLAASTGLALVNGIVAKTLDDSSLSSSGVVPVQGFSSIALDGVALASAGNVPVVGTEMTALDAVLLSSSGTAPVNGAFETTLQGVLVLSDGASLVQGALGGSLDDLTTSATGFAITTVQLTATFEGVTLDSRADIFTTAQLAATLEGARGLGAAKGAWGARLLSHASYARLLRC